MTSLISSIETLAGQWKMAGLEGIVFFAGLLSAGVVLRYRLAPLMSFPMWLAERLAKFLASKPRLIFVFLFIFLFNSTAIFIYMMSGILLQILPTVICFITGMNIGIIGATAPSMWNTRPYGGMSASEDDATSSEQSDEHPRPKPYLQVVGTLIVVMLELPAFWFAIAMGSTVSSSWLPLAAPDLADSVVPRLVAYGTVIVPVLAFSALVEAAVVTHALKTRRPTDLRGELGGPDVREEHDDCDNC